jgi:hypothetical protein
MKTMILHVQMILMMNYYCQLPMTLKRKKRSSAGSDKKHFFSISINQFCERLKKNKFFSLVSLQ